MGGVETLPADHPSLQLYAKDCVYSATLKAVGGPDFTARGHDAIVKQWAALRNAYGTKLDNATGKKVSVLRDDLVVQSFENIDLFKDGKKTCSYRILAEVWMLVDGEWKIVADYGMVTKTY